VKAGDSITARLMKGRLKATVTDVTEEDQ
jgi:hypothetical protein